MVGDISGSFSMLHQNVSRGSWAVDARLAVRQQSCRDSVREGLPVADSYASRTRARNTANQPPAAASAAGWAARCSPTQSAAGTALASPRRCDGCDGGVS